MLFILTGLKQTGKTRWLEATVARLEDEGVSCHGVLAPGQWTAHADGSLEKTGINNILLPQHETVLFARRIDLAQGEGSYDEGTQAAQAHLDWHISEEALARVNAHFAMLMEAPPAQRAVLIIDELGPLELKRGGGLAQAVRLLEAGPQDRYDHAIVVVREKLVDLAEERFAPIWGSCKLIQEEDLR